MNKGLLYAVGAYIIWGLLPLYWKSVEHVSAMEILTHRVVWALFVALGLVALSRQWAWMREVIHSPRTLLTFAATATLISVNWFLYIWAVNNNHIVETSLGYFINPLVSVLLGVVFLKERLRLWQGVAVVIALCGVLYLTVEYGSLPWISLSLACTFGLYGLLRKTAMLNSLQGLTLETLFLFVPALVYLLIQEALGTAAFGHAGFTTNVLLILAGIVTAVPLLLYTQGARLITLTTLGILQYIAPTIQLLLAVYVYHESLPASRLYGFCFIWLALIVYTIESLLRTRQMRNSGQVAAIPNKATR